MKKELEMKLAEKYPFMRRGKSLHQQHNDGFVCDLYSAFGCECGDGWYKVIDKLCSDIQKVYQENNLPVLVHVDQIKEKYGTLRFYAGIGGPDEVYDKVFNLIDKAEERTGHVCEICGKRGFMHYDGYMRVLCLDCQHYEEVYHRVSNEVYKLFKGKVDKTGKPYYDHLTFVARHIPWGCSIDAAVAALLHDTLEDTDYTMDAMRSTFGLSYVSCAMIAALTRKSDMTYREYIESIANNTLRDAARIELVCIKLADLLHNTQEERVDKLMSLDPRMAMSLQKRYHAAMERLFQVLSSFVLEGGETFVIGLGDFAAKIAEQLAMLASKRGGDGSCVDSHVLN